MVAPPFAVFEGWARRALIPEALELPAATCRSGTFTVLCSSTNTGHVRHTSSKAKAGPRPGSGLGHQNTQTKHWHGSPLRVSAKDPGDQECPLYTYSLWNREIPDSAGGGSAGAIASVCAGHG